MLTGRNRQGANYTKVLYEHKGTIKEKAWEDSYGQWTSNERVTQTECVWCDKLIRSIQTISNELCQLTVHKRAKTLSARWTVRILSCRVGC